MYRTGQELTIGISPVREWTRQTASDIGE